MQKSYTIALSKSEVALFEKVDIYAYLNAEDTRPLFQQATHAQYAYYRAKTPAITMVDGYKRALVPSNIDTSTLYICLSKGRMLTLLRNIFFNKKKHVFFIEDTPDKNDVEFTWHTIQNKRNLKDYTKIVFDYPHWSKIVYSYRASTIYGLYVIDVSA